MRQEICDVMRECYQRGWITTRDGNCSVRYRERDYMYITPSGHRKNVLDREDLVRIRMKIADDGVTEEMVIPEGAIPSGELHMHYLLQSDLGLKTRTVLHAHPTHVIAAMYRGFNLQLISSHFPEIFRYTTVGPTVPEIPAVTKELGEATFDAIHMNDKSFIFGNIVNKYKHKDSYSIVGQANHGVTSVGFDPWSAFEHIERLEHICQIVLASGVSPLESMVKVPLDCGH